MSYRTDEMRRLMEAETPKGRRRKSELERVRQEAAIENRLSPRLHKLAEDRMRAFRKRKA